MWQMFERLLKWLPQLNDDDADTHDDAEIDELHDVIDVCDIEINVLDEVEVLVLDDEVEVGMFDIETQQHDKLLLLVFDEHDELVDAPQHVLLLRETDEVDDIDTINDELDEQDEYEVEIMSFEVLDETDEILSGCEVMVEVDELLLLLVEEDEHDEIDEMQYEH